MNMNSLDDVPVVAERLISMMDHHTVFAFYGELGAGKTTLIAEICKQLGVSGTVTSPSFAIVNEYGTKGGNSIYHFDFYRIKDISEAFDIGYEEYFFSGNLCLIEWPEMIEELLPNDFVQVFIRPMPDASRLVTIKISGSMA